MDTSSRIDHLLERLRATQLELEREIEAQLEHRRREFRYSLHRGKVVFERGIRRLQRRQRTGLLRYLREAPILYVLSAPVIYGMVIPLALLDISITIYQHVCFRVYGVPRVKRSDYVVIDRHHLAYLNAIEKLNCIYCGYGNGLIAYAREITARTEQFWCPVKHARRASGPHDRADRFIEYGDVDAWQAGLDRLRNDLRREQADHA